MKQLKTTKKVAEGPDELTMQEVTEVFSPEKGTPFPLLAQLERRKGKRTGNNKSKAGNREGEKERRWEAKGRHTDRKANIECHF